MEPYRITRTIRALLAALLVAAGCAAPQQKPGHEIKFVVLGNTSPASPFTGYAEKLEFVFQAINQENPMMVIHTGNIIQGGTEWMGVTRNDIDRQYETFLGQKKLLRPLIHILAGEKDLYNNSLELFTRYTGERLYYSFNYGNIHFILLHVLSRDHRIDRDQIKWLKRDLETNRYAAAIFVFTHYPVLSSPQSGIRHKDGDELHRLFVQYPVKAVISGSVKNTYEYDKDGIRYAAAGCYGYNYEDWHWSYTQYYVAAYDGTKLNLKGVRVNFPGNAYRPKVFKDETEKKN
ncbi:MAG TPA: metallophosphoesterase [Spirochaetota bacterium]|nr:metallophosphoesterase [Spirochaetota bacterium]HPC42022.1 metallophosphoesterase [Spirochaetota bacterium]HPL17881.1 metallophosphoesterase [Spirochaetota bacterium]HQF09539.1 metallophosphoesterase [Spirochaetota bacterium]HQH98391.1 metallophosphoesterase [Spirochaetota bacterium]